MLMRHINDYIISPIRYDNSIRGDTLTERRRYTVYVSYATVVEGARAAAEIVALTEAHGRDMPLTGLGGYYYVGDFPTASVDEISVEPFALVNSGMTAIFREVHDGLDPLTIRFAIMERRGQLWVTRGIISGPNDDDFATTKENIELICRQTWGK